jgi:hypothetical protein
VNEAEKPKPPAAGRDGAERRRLFLSLLPAALLLLANVLVFAPFVVYQSNPQEFEVGFLDMLQHMAWIHAGLLALILLPGGLASAKFLEKYVPLVFTLGLLTWLQSNLLIWDYGVFDGRGASWAQFDWLGWIDLAVWAAALLMAFRFSRRVLPLVSLTAWLLVAGQAVLLLAKVPEQEGFWRRDIALGFPEGLSELSRTQNVFHLILDSFQSDVFLELLNEQDAFEDFAGFTQFYENAGVAPHTSFAVPATLLGRIYDGSGSPSDYYKEALNHGLQVKLMEAGFNVNLVPLLSMAASPHSNYFEVPSSYQGSFSLVKNINTAQLADVGLFRVAPHFLRKRLFDDGNWWLLPKLRGEIKPPSFQDKAFFSDYIDRLKPGGEAPAYHFLHLNPPHPPYQTLADGAYAGEVLANTRENYVNEARAIFRLLARLVQRLQSLGLYDSAFIVFQGDHGSQIKPVVAGEEVQPCLARLPALLAVKPFGAEPRPLQVSAAPTTLLDIAPTILGAVAGEQGPLFSIDPAAARPRPYMVFNDSSEVARIRRFEIEGSVFDPRSCRSQGDVEVALDHSTYHDGVKFQFGMTGNADAIKGLGWTSCGAQHCWSIARHVTLRLKTSAPDKDHTLSVRLMPFVRPPAVPVQRIGLSVNGHFLEEWVATSNQVQNFSARIPAALLKGADLSVEFSLPDAVVPANIGAGGDKRLLAIAMIALQLDAVEQ